MNMTAAKEVPFGSAVEKRMRVTCKHCGNNRLKWQYTVQGWRTFEGGVMHKCPAFGNSTVLQPIKMHFFVK